MHYSILPELLLFYTSTRFNLGLENSVLELEFRTNLYNVQQIGIILYMLIHDRKKYESTRCLNQVCYYQCEEY